MRDCDTTQHPAAMVTLLLDAAALDAAILLWKIVLILSKVLGAALRNPPNLLVHSCFAASKRWAGADMSGDGNGNGRW